MGGSSKKGKGKGSTSSSGSVSGNPSGGRINAQVIGGSNFSDHPGIDSLRNTPNINLMGTPPAGTLGGARTPGAIIPPNIVGTPVVYQSYSPAQPRPFPSVMDNSRPGGT